MDGEEQTGQKREPPGAAKTQGGSSREGRSQSMEQNVAQVVSRRPGIPKAPIQHLREVGQTARGEQTLQSGQMLGEQLHLVRIVVDQLVAECA